MIELFLVDHTALSDEKLFAFWLARADGARRAKVENLIRREDKNASLAAGIILPLALRARGYAGDIRVEAEAGGKPRLIVPQGVHFNLSHSGKYTVLALSDTEVGVDVQQKRAVDLRVARRYFSPEEWAHISAAEDKEGLFYRYWTAKESYLKALGTGLARPLNSFTVRFGGGAEIDDPHESGEWSVREYCGLKGYALAVCCRASAAASTTDSANINAAAPLTARDLTGEIINCR